MTTHDNGSRLGPFGAYRQQGCREGIVDWGKHGDALVVSIQVELQSFALQSINVADQLHKHNLVHPCFPW